LGGIRDDFAKDRPIRREQNESLREIKQNTSKKTFEGPEFLDSTADMMGRAMERILGITPEEETIAALLGPLDAIATATTTTAEQASTNKNPIATGGHYEQWR
jgi:hypothetical protein